MNTTKHRKGSRKAPESRRLNGALGHNYVTDPLKKKKKKTKRKKEEEEGKEEEGEEEEWTFVNHLPRGSKR